jgi:hypothetical protein
MERVSERILPQVNAATADLLPECWARTEAFCFTASRGASERNFPKKEGSALRFFGGACSKKLQFGA